MDLTTFLQQRRPDWKRLEEILAHVEGSGLATLDDDQAVEFGRLYRRAASDLNQAQTFVSGEATVQYLNDLVARCYLIIHAKSKIDLRALLWHLLWGFPIAFRRHYRAVLLATALLFLGVFFGLLASFFDRDTARAYLLPHNMPMIQPSEEGVESDEPLMTTGQLAGFSSILFANNATASLIAFVLGITMGLGTGWVLFYNGVIMGALAAEFFQAGQYRAFATGILPHGVLEIPAILIGGAAGFVLAQGLIQARPWSRLEEITRKGKEALLLVAGFFPLLGMAAILEAGVARAPDRFLSSGLKLTVAGLFALLFAVYVLLLGWRIQAKSV